MADSSAKPGTAPTRNQGRCEPTSDTGIICTFQVSFLASDTLSIAGMNGDREKVRLMYWRSSIRGR